METTIRSLRLFLMKKIDKKDISQVEKVERYLELKRMMTRLIKIVDEEGDTIVVETKNGIQTKAHPLISQIAAINKQMLDTEKTFVWDTSETSKNRVKLL